MSDVEIVFPQGREAVVRRLHDALAEAGYDVAAREVGEAAGAAAGNGASAVLILWDRSTMAHPGLKAAASAARKQNRALDVSVDGITPLGLNDDSALIHLSGWRGDPHHPGWRKILARLDQLCRPSREAVLVRAAPRTAHAPATPRANDEAPARSARGRRGVLASAAAALLLVAAAAALLISRRPPANSPSPAAPPVAAQPAATTPQATPAPANQAATGQSMPAAGPVGETQSAQVVGQAAAPQVTTPSADASRPVRVAAGGAVPKRAHRAKARHDARRPVIRYTRYSGTMRLFCERSGRGTPQCRIFNAAMRNHGIVR